MGVDIHHWIGGHLEESGAPESRSRSAYILSSIWLTRYRRDKSSDLLNVPSNNRNAEKVF